MSDRTMVTFSEVLSEENWIQVLPLGEWMYPTWDGMKDILVDERMLTDFVANFDGGVAGKPLPVDAEHRYDAEGAHGWIEELQARDAGLFARVEWTDRGKTAIENKRFRFVSSEFAEKYRNNKGKLHRNVFLGAGLTVRPFIKTDELEELPQPVQASEGLFITCREPAGDPSEGATQEAIDMDELQKLRGELTGQIDGLREAAEAKDGQITELNDQLTALTAERDQAATELGEVRLREQRAEIETQLGEKPFPEAHLKRFADLLMRVEDVELRGELADAIAQVEIVDTEERGFTPDPKRGGDKFSDADRKRARELGITEEDLEKYGGEVPDFVSDGDDDDEE